MDDICSCCKSISFGTVTSSPSVSIRPSSWDWSLEEKTDSSSTIIQSGRFDANLEVHRYWWFQEQRRFAMHALRNVGFNNATTQVFYLFDHQCDHCQAFLSSVPNSTFQSTVIRYAHEIIARWKEQGANRTPVDLTHGCTVGVANIIWQHVFGRTLVYDDPLIAQVKHLAEEVAIFSAKKGRALTTNLRRK